MRTILLPVILTLFLFSCKKEAGPYQPVKLCSDLTDNPDSIQKYLSGRWVWIEDRVISRENGYNYYTPQMMGYKDYATFTGDTVTFIRIGKEALFCRFKIVPEKEITFWPEDKNIVLVTYDLTTGQYASYYRIYICKNYLKLGQTYRSDIAPDRIYKRLK